MRKRAPNVLFILCDELKATSLGLYGNDDLSTPQLETLAGDGVFFEHAFCTAPVCVPSRVSMMTGCYPHRTNAWTNETLLPERMVTIPDVLGARGYQIVLSGKNHCFPAERMGVFDVCFHTGHGGVSTRHAHGQSVVIKQWLQDNRSVLRSPCGALPCPHPVEGQGSYCAVDFVDTWLRHDRDSSRPFFIWLSIPDPHTPFQCSEPYASMFDPAQLVLPPEDSLDGKPEIQRIARKMFGMDNSDEDVIRKVIAIYYGMVRAIDDQLGRLFATLRECRLWDNTLVIFTSDHGDYLGEHGLIRKHLAFYDCLMRVPMIMSYPGVLSPGRRVPDPVTLVDLMPTLLDACDCDIPAHVQGESMWRALRDTPWRHRDAVFAEAGSGLPPVGWHALDRIPAGPLDASVPVWGARPSAWAGRGRMVRTRDWKLVTYDHGDGELYNLRTDPHELHNLFRERRYAARIAGLQESMRRFMAV